MFKELGEYNQAPRLIFTENDFGAPFGQPMDSESQINLIKTCLSKLTE